MRLGFFNSEKKRGNIFKSNSETFFLIFLLSPLHFIFSFQIFFTHYLFPILGNLQNSIISLLPPEQDMKALFPFSCKREKEKNSDFFNGSNYFCYSTPSILFPTILFLLLLLLQLKVNVVV